MQHSSPAEILEMGITQHRIEETIVEYNIYNQYCRYEFVQVYRRDIGDNILQS